MSPHDQMHRLHRMLRIAGAIVPKGRRSTWHAEWVAEISYVYLDDPAAADSLAQGLLPDAISLRKLDLQHRWESIDWRSPAVCIKFLTGCLAVLFAINFLQPHVRHLLSSIWGVWTFGTFVTLAIFAVPSTVVVSGYGACEAYRGDAASAWQRFARWRFLITKFVLAALCGYFLAVQVILLLPPVLKPLEGGLAIACGLIFNAFTMTWVFTDQRQRCPTCMRSLRHPAHMGVPSWSLLHANATEEMCDQGHGLLHQPEWRTSWFENARWVQLDRTWRELFRD
ncbi:hypothetical protein [Terriglobus roseus]|uniref:Uncharacterized protein n=1 Tax=Terriglobus roseus TaxID=392734 RepID=A0A1G7N9L8_9BACT|nr:hypothetical protein [Terriglobus roseus]SDF69990.1 hypothetical protein SAMN05444167_3040 [Terriglobus roseus]